MRLRTCAAALGASALLSACGASATRTGNTGPASSATRTVTKTVTATSPATATATATVPTTPTGATATCTPRQLGIHYVNSRGAAGTAYEEFAFVNVSSNPCVLKGYPGVSLVLAGGNVDDVKNTRDPARPPKSVTVVSGGQATFVIGVHGDAASPCVQATHLRFIPPNTTAYEQIAHPQQVCGGDVVVSAVGYGNA